MSDTSMKQFLYLAAKNLFGLKISREEFEQSKHENFDLSENLKCMFDKQNRKIINTEDLNTVNGKDQFIERENFNKELNSNVFDYNYVSQFTSSVGQMVSPKPQIFDSITSESSSEEKGIFKDSENSTPFILKSTPISETVQETPSNLTSTPEIIQKTPSDLSQTLILTQQPPIIPTEEKRDFNNLEDNAPIILKPSPNPEITQETPSDLVQTQAPAQQPPIIPIDQTEKQESPKPKDEILNFSVNTPDSEDKKDSINLNHANQYYKSLVNNVFPGYFDINSESSGYNMEGGENEMFEDQKASILEEAKAYQTIQTQPQTTPTTKQDIIKLDDETNENLTSENNQKENLILDPENETKQINLEKPSEIKKASETEKEIEDIKDVEPEEIKEEAKDIINITPSDNEKQKEQEENNLNAPSFLESNIIKGGELPPDSSISQNTQNIILNAFNELTDKKKNNLF